MLVSLDVYCIRQMTGGMTAGSADLTLQPLRPSHVQALKDLKAKAAKGAIGGAGLKKSGK